MKISKNPRSTALRNLLSLALATMAFAGIAKGQLIVGTLEFDQNASGASFTTTSFTLVSNNLILSNNLSNPASPSGDFSTLGGTNLAFSGLDQTMTGVSTDPANPTTVTSTPFLSFGNFTFYLTSIYMTTSNGITVSVLGTGTLLDPEEGYASTPAEFSISGTTPNGPYGGTFTTTGAPEPSTWALMLYGVPLLLLAHCLRMRHTQ